MRGRCAGQPAAPSPAPGGVLLALLGGALLGLGLVAGERGLDLLEGEPQLALRQPLRTWAELHALQLAQQVPQPLGPLRQRVPLGRDAVALGYDAVALCRDGVALR